MKNCLKSSLPSKAGGASLNMLTSCLTSHVGGRIQVRDFCSSNSEALAVTLCITGSGEC